MSRRRRGREHKRPGKMADLVALEEECRRDKEQEKKRNAETTCSLALSSNPEKTNEKERKEQGRTGDREKKKVRVVNPISRKKSPHGEGKDRPEKNRRAKSRGPMGKLVKKRKEKKVHRTPRCIGAHMKRGRKKRKKTATLNLPAERLGEKCETEGKEKKLWFQHRTDVQWEGKGVSVRPNRGQKG